MNEQLTELMVTDHFKLNKYSKQFDILGTKLEEYVKLYDLKDYVKQLTNIPTYLIMSKEGQDMYCKLLTIKPELLEINNRLMVDATIHGINVKEFIEHVDEVIAISLKDIGVDHMFVETDFRLTTLYFIYVLVIINNNISDL